ncbi:MAG TPA: hypothetical protein VG942_11405 [Hyphomonadaceae bacterium]|nr:hypothetical protein [Hyphomonadaceae bacterium]
MFSGFHVTPADLAIAIGVIVALFLIFLAAKGAKKPGQKPGGDQPRRNAWGDGGSDLAAPPSSGKFSGPEHASGHHMGHSHGYHGDSGHSGGDGGGGGGGGDGGGGGH